MTSAKILLSSRERKSCFRAAQVVVKQDSMFSEYADDICEKLDDGGIWDPCFILVSSDSGPKFSSLEKFVVILKMGQDGLPNHAHNLRMVESRVIYIERRDSTPHSGLTPPFLTRDDYYGPDWASVREAVISEDCSECVGCGIGREEHRERYGTDLHVHHKTPLRDIGSYKRANRPENLVTLCWSCHAARES